MVRPYRSRPVNTNLTSCHRLPVSGGEEKNALCLRIGFMSPTISTAAGFALDLPLDGRFDRAVSEAGRERQPGVAAPSRDYRRDDRGGVV